MTEEKNPKKPNRFSRFLRIIGPGLITGAADDDPSGIATYSQTGTQFGFGMLWTVVFLYPLMSAVQEACGRIGAVTGKGMAAVVRDNYSKKILFPVVLLVVIANTINIGSDIGAMAEAMSLIVPLPFLHLTLIFTIIMLSLELFLSYRIYARILKWLALALLAYPITAIISANNWPEIIRSTVIPHIQFEFGFFFILTGVLGTTISPYLFFWQASEEVEEEIKDKRLSANSGLPPRISNKFLRALKIDTLFGMLFSQLVMLSIIITTASVLNANGVTNIETAADAAKALEPLVSTFPNAGLMAKSIFAIGVVGVGLLAVPVLAGSASYALSESLRWHEGLSQKINKARGFYGVIIVATLIGLSLNFVGIDPIKALVFTAVFNGVAAVPLIFLIAKVSGNEKIMGEHKNSSISTALLWLTFAAMGGSAIIMFASFAGR